MNAKEGLESQAKKMLKVSNHRFLAGKVGNTVKLRIPDVDRVRSDRQNLLAMILEVKNEAFLSVRNETWKIFTVVYQRSIHNL